MGHVSIPLDLLIGNELVEDMFAEGLFYELAFFELLYRLKQVSRKLGKPSLLSLFGAELVDVLLDRWRKIVSVTDK